MDNRQIDNLIDRARRAYIRRPEYTGRDPIIADCDVFVRNNRDVVQLRDGEEVLAEFRLTPSTGELRCVRISGQVASTH